MKQLSFLLFLLSLMILILPLSFAQTPTPTPSPTMIGDLLWSRTFYFYDATDPDNPPLADVLVTAAAKETVSAMTDENGNCSISVLAHDTGSVNVTALKAGYVAFNETYPGLPISGSITIALEQDPEGTPNPDLTPDPTPVPVRGDVNEDGAIDIIDALITAQYYVGLDVVINLTAADANCDGSVDIIDALLIAQYYVGTIESFC